MKTKAMVLLIGVLSSTASAQQVMGEHLKGIQEGSIQGTYLCRGTAQPQKDVQISYRLAPDTAEHSRVTALVVRGEEFGEKELALVNSAIHGRGIEGVTVRCSSAEIEVILTLFVPEKAKVEYVVLEKRRGASLEIRR